MNSDEIQSAITKLVIAMMTGVATKYGMDGNTLTMIAAGVGAFAAFLYGVFQHWNMTKVPEKSMVTVPGASAPVIATAVK